VAAEVRAKRLAPASTLICNNSGCNNKANGYHHHRGYEPQYWLDVIALCQKHHTKIHTNPPALA